MISNRRNILELTGLASLGSLLDWGCQSEIRPSGSTKHDHIFNMSGYAAPTLDLVRIGIIAVTKVFQIFGFQVAADRGKLGWLKGLS